MNTIKTFKETYGIHITTKMNGKMEGMQSLSTSSLSNPICVERAKDKTSICHKCYANSMQGMYTNLAQVLAKNTEVLTNIFIPSSDWCKVNASVFRLEAFGDLANELQFRNYLEFCKANERTTFTIWTKNPAIMANVFETEAKPKNLIIGISSPHMNVQSDVSKWNFVDFVFTVYDFDYATAHDTKINCGNRKCLECLKCYTKRNDGKVFYVNEILKSDSRKYYKWLANKQAA